MASQSAAKSVAIIGAGAVGSYYGARLAQAGHDVRFLMRRDYEAVQANGLTVTSSDGDFVLESATVARSSAEIGPVDWVVCALKTTSLAEVPALVGPCVGPDTRILCLMNGLGVEERFAEWFGGERIFGGLAFTCINRGQPGCVNHLRYGAVTVGHFHNDAAEVDQALDLWSGATVEFTGTESLLRSRWEKLGWNIPFNGLCVAGGGITTDLVVGDPDLRAAARRSMEEVAAAGNADLAAHGEASRIDPAAMIDRMFSLTDAMGAYRPSTMIDFVDGQPMEVEEMFVEPLRRARALGVDTPHIALLTGLMDRLNRNNLSGKSD
jgi:2-dehydropantoate 2-reductase